MRLGLCGSSGAVVWALSALRRELYGHSRGAKGRLNDFICAVKARNRTHLAFCRLRICAGNSEVSAKSVYHIDF